MATLELLSAEELAAGITSDVEEELCDGSASDVEEAEDADDSELASLDEPASPPACPVGRADRLLELADSELEEDEAVSEPASPAGWDDDSDDDWDGASLGDTDDEETDTADEAETSLTCSCAKASLTISIIVSLLTISLTTVTCWTIFSSSSFSIFFSSSVLTDGLNTPKTSAFWLSFSSLTGL